MLEIELANESVVLLPQRALLWPRERTLFVADAHFGKDAAFRAGGLAVPDGTTGETLAVLDALIVRHGVARIVFLGDFLHARAARTPRTLDALAAWRATHPALDLTLVRGNHDRHAGDPPDPLGIAVMAEPHACGPFAACHLPAEVPGAYALAGHLHPAYVVRGRAHQSARLPCFLLGERCGVLPAFGRFTGMAPVGSRSGDRVFVIADDNVLPVPLSSIP
jgi:DNA ligase-associated metallophosphoesterase